MKITSFLNQSILLALLLYSCQGAAQDPPCDKAAIYYGVEINGIICGFSESYQCPVEGANGPQLKVMDQVQVKMTLLGQDVDMAIRNTYLLDTSGIHYFYCKHEIEVGPTVQLAITEVQGDKIFFTKQEGEAPQEVTRDPEVILESPLTSPHLIRDFVSGDLEQADYKVFDDMQGKVVTKRYKLLGKEQIELAGTNYQATQLEELNLFTGTTSRIWIDDASGFTLQIEVAGRRIYLADASVKKKIRMADMDNMLFARVEKVIPDIHNITYMKVKAGIQSAGEWIIPEKLNIRGQKFTGTVEDNFIEGIFELTSLRYTGQNSPGFPYDHPLPDSLNEYVQPGDLIESDHPDLVAEARRITAGAENAWEATVRLCRWVAGYVEGAVPGGTSAINTYRTRKGECGSHSRLLAALCRASGIPARLSIGCMYSTYLGGSFGQHAWVEAYMGEDGWIAIDASAEEYDYIDAGHIRLGERTSFNPKSMEILDYRVGNDSSGAVADEVPERYAPYLGKYTLLKNAAVFTVLYQDGSMVVDIPDRMMLALEDPDEEMRWYPKLTRQINFRFEEDDSGAVKAMCLQQLIPVPREKVNTEAGNGTHGLDRFTGSYVLGQANVTFTITRNADSLLLEDPVTKRTALLIPDEDQFFWTLENDRNKIRFEENEDGSIRAMTYYEHIMLERGEPVSNALRQWIDEQGIEAGIGQFYEMKSDERAAYLITENDLNNLGYSYLNEGRILEAIAVFQLNTDEYPKSWNAYGSLAEAYVKNGDQQLAIENYEHSVELNPDNTRAKNAIEELKAGF